MTNYILSLSVTLLLAMWRLTAIREELFSRVGKLPSWLQPLPPLVLGALAVLGQGWTDGLRGDALVDNLQQNGGQVGLVAIAAWHIWKRVKTPIAKNATKIGILLVLILPGCFATRPSWTADAWPVLCQTQLYAVPAIKERAAKLKIPLEELVVKACTAEDVIEPLAAAVNQALIDAKKKGLLDEL